MLYRTKTLSMLLVVLNFIKLSLTQYQTEFECQFLRQNQIALSFEHTNDFTKWIYLVKTQNNEIQMRKHQIDTQNNDCSYQIIVSAQQFAQFATQGQSFNVTRIVAAQKLRFQCLMILVSIGNKFQYRIVYQNPSNYIYTILKTVKMTPNPQTDNIQFDSASYQCQYYRINENIYYTLTNQKFLHQPQGKYFQIAEGQVFAINHTNIFIQDFGTRQFYPYYQINFTDFSLIHIKMYWQYAVSSFYKFIVYGYKQIMIDDVPAYEYKLQIYKMFNGLFLDKAQRKLTYVQTIVGTSYIFQPNFYFDQKLQVIIIGQTLKNIHNNYVGFSISYLERIKTQVVFPYEKQVSEKQFYISVPYLYFKEVNKNLNNKNIKYNGFLFLVQPQLFILNQQQLFQQSSTNLHASSFVSNVFTNYYLMNNNKTLKMKSIRQQQTLKNFFIQQFQWNNNNRYTQILVNYQMQQQNWDLYDNPEQLLIVQNGIFYLYSQYDNLSEYKIHLYNSNSQNKKVLSQNFDRQNCQQLYATSNDNCIMILLQTNYYQSQQNNLKVYHYNNQNQTLKQYVIESREIQPLISKFEGITVSSQCSIIRFLEYGFFYYLNQKKQKYQPILIKDDMWDVWDPKFPIFTDNSFHFVIYHQKLYIFNEQKKKYQIYQNQFIDQNNRNIILNDQNVLISNKNLSKVLILSRNTITKLSTLFLFSLQKNSNNNNLINSILIKQNITSGRALISGAIFDDISNIIYSTNQNFDIIVVFDLFDSKLNIFRINWQKYESYQVNINNNSIILSDYLPKSIKNTNHYIYIYFIYIEQIYKIDEIISISSNLTQNNLTNFNFKLFSKINLEYNSYLFFYGQQNQKISQDQQNNLIIKNILTSRQNKPSLDQIYWISNQILNKIYYHDYNYTNSNLTTNIPAILVSKNKTFQYQRCQPGCSSCVTSRFCENCNIGYNLNLTHYFCQKCYENCKFCQYSDISKCSECYTGYYLKNQLCFKCHYTCLQCSFGTFNSCLSCDKGKFLKERQRCQSCPENCDNCTELSKCLDCSYGYGLSKQYKCTKCPLNCINCNGSETQTCISCKYGFYMKISDKNIRYCQKCVLNCKICNDSQKCVQCFQNHFMSADKKCFPLCQYPCLTCANNNPKQCTLCTIDYKLNKTSNQCVPNIQCNLNASCIGCPFGYYLVYGICRKCFNNSVCRQCNKYNSRQCLQCIKGYYLFRDECLPCSEQCQQCYTFNSCKKCSYGFMVINYDQGQQQLRCVKCSFNCKTCIYSITNCLSCNQSYILSGSTCVWQRQISFKLTLNIDFKSLNNDLIASIITSISSILQKNASFIKTKSIQPSSIIFTGGVQVKDLEDETNVAKKAQTISQGSLIAGYNVQSSQFVSTVTFDSSQNNQLKTILFITIPVAAVAIIFTIGYTCFLRWRRIKKKKQELQQEQRMNHSDIFQMERDKRRQQRLAKKVGRFLPSLKASHSFPSLTSTAHLSNLQSERNSQNIQAQNHFSNASSHHSKVNEAAVKSQSYDSNASNNHSEVNKEREVNEVNEINKVNEVDKENYSNEAQESQNYLNKGINMGEI